jgi:LacI family transcriptional regulator
MAHGLITNRSGIIGIIIHDISDAYFAEIVKGVQEVLFDYDYIVNIYNTYRNVDKELRAVNMLIANRADAVVLTGGTLLDSYYKEKMQQYIEELKSYGSIVIGVTSHPFAIKNIKIGNEYIVKTIYNYLASKGHQKIAYINGPELLSTTQNRFSGYKQALLERKAVINKNLIIKSDFTFMGGRKAALELLDHLGEFTAVIASNDELLTHL